MNIKKLNVYMRSKENGRLKTDNLIYVLGDTSVGTDKFDWAQQHVEEISKKLYRNSIIKMDYNLPENSNSGYEYVTLKTSEKSKLDKIIKKENSRKLELKRFRY